jgi:hypothetical protein
VTGSMRVMSGTLDADSKGFVASPTNEIHVKTRLSWMPQLQGTTQLQDYGQWPQDWTI